MKKTLLLCACMAAGLIGAAQSNSRFTERKVKHHPGTNAPIEHAGSRAIIWSDNFSSASNWTLGDIDDANDDHWTIGTDEPAGTFSSTYGAIESTTAANGFALFDSDFLCGGSQQAWVMNAAPIDLSGYPGAVLEFEQFFTRFRGDCFVDVSVNGTDWTEFEVNAEINVNASTPNPELTTVNISSVVANQATVWIRFRYFSTVAVHGPGSGCDYAWMVDDVALLELEPYELVMNFGVISHTGNGEEYGRVPQDQLNAQMNLGAEVLNFGSEAQTGLTINVLITDDGGATILDQTFAQSDLAAGETVFMDELVTLPALDEGIYDVAFTVTSNEAASENDPLDNIAARQFAIDNNTYALDGIDVYDANELTGIGSTSFEGAADGLEILTYYELANPTTVYAISAELAGGTEVNSAVIVSIFDTTSVFAENLLSPIAQSDVISVTTANLVAGRVTALILPPIDLPAGGYYASVRLLSSANAFDIFILDDNTVPQPGASSLIYDPSDLNIYSNGNASAVRMVLDPSVSVNELSTLDGISLAPNPTNGLVTVHSTNYGTHNIEVLNVLGDVLLVERFMGSTTIDLSALAPGSYLVRIANADGIAVQRVTRN
jgi:Secretion system C-terminal sorting domain